MASVEELCDDIALINSSHVVLSGSVNEIRRSYSRNLFEVVVDNGEVMQISPSRDEGANELLAELMKNHRIVSFREILPSMNDIFVEKVLGKEAKQ
jgi:ABC-2 type transport system ATP-binding protein